MNIEEIKKAGYDALEKRRAELLGMDPDDERFDVDEANAIAKRMKDIEDAAAARSALEKRARDGIDAGEFKRIDIPGSREDEPCGVEAIAASAEYRSAWLKNLASDCNMSCSFSTSMSEAEKRAFTFLTSNSDPVVPTETKNRIVELVESSATILNDITVDGFEKVYEVIRHKSIDEGDAKKTDENAANDDEKDTFDTIPLTGQEIKKHINVSRKMQVQSVDAFEDWVVRHLAARMAVAKEKLVIANILDTGKGMASANKVETAESGAISDSDILGLIALLKTGGEDGGTAFFYANNKTIWTQLAEVKDANGRPIYKDSTDPALAMIIHGFGVKKAENVEDGKVLVGYPKLVAGNSFDPISIMSDVNVKTREATVSAFEIFDCALEVPEAFAQLSVKA